MAASDAEAPTTGSTAGGVAGRSGLFPGPVRLNPKPVGWLPACGAVQAGVVFDLERRAFVADLAGVVQAFDSEHRLLWQQTLVGGISATPAVDVDGARLLVGTHAGWVCALRTTDGAVLWQQRLPSRSDSRIVGDLLHLPGRGSLIASSWGGRFHELDVVSGATLRTWDAGISPQAGASGDRWGHVYCLRAVRDEGVALVRVGRSGTEEVLHRVPESPRGASRMTVAASPVVDETRGTVGFVTNDGRRAVVHAWSLGEERLRWSQTLEQGVVATPALLGDGTIVVADLGGAVHAFGPDGALRFRHSTGGDYLLAGPVADVAGRLFLGDPLGRLHVLEKDGSGGPVFEGARALQARASFDERGNLYLPSTAGGVHVFANLASNQ